MRIKRNYERYENMTFEDLCNIFTRLTEQKHFKNFTCHKIEHRNTLPNMNESFRKVIFHTTNNLTNEKYIFTLHVYTDNLSCQMADNVHFGYASLTLKSFEYLLKEKFVIIRSDEVV